MTRFNGRWMTVVLLVSSGCATHRGPTAAVDPALRDLAGSARVAYQRGEVGRASELYGRALERAREVGDAQETASQAYHLALCRLASGRPAESHALLAQARGLLPARGGATARTWLAEAEAALREGKSDEAGRLVQRALASGADREGRAQGNLILATQASEAHNPAESARLLAMARKDLRAAASPALEARAAGLDASLALAGGDAAESAAALERQAEWLRQAGDYRGMAEALLGAGTRYQSAQHPQEAYPCLLRAAASLKAAGDRAKSEVAIAAAQSVARDLKQAEWLAAADALADEIRKP